MELLRYGREAENRPDQRGQAFRFLPSRQGLANGKTMKTGVFGGSFDPVHYGHLLLAEQCLELAKLDRILFIPAAHSPLKKHSPIASDRNRVEMLQLAIADHPQFAISDLELKRGDISYTVDTLQELQSLYPDDTLYLMIGADSLRDFPRWKSPEIISSLAQLLITTRPHPDGSYEDQIPWDELSSLVGEAAVESWKQSLVATDAFDFSSTDLRQRADDRRSLRYRTPRAVEMYIQTQRLYQKTQNR